MLAMQHRSSLRHLRERDHLFDHVVEAVSVARALGLALDAEGAAVERHLQKDTMVSGSVNASVWRLSVAGGLRPRRVEQNLQLDLNVIRIDAGRGDRHLCGRMHHGGSRYWKPQRAGGVGSNRVELG